MLPKNKPLFRLITLCGWLKLILAQLLLITDYENFDISFMELDVPFSQVMGESTKKIYEKALTIRDDIKIGGYQC